MILNFFLTSCRFICLICLYIQYNNFCICVVLSFSHGSYFLFVYSLKSLRVNTFLILIRLKLTLCNYTYAFVAYLPYYFFKRTNILLNFLHNIVNLYLLLFQYLICLIFICKRRFIISLDLVLLFPSKQALFPGKFKI